MNMRNIFLLIIISLLASCSQKNNNTQEKNIDTGEYFIMSFQVTNVVYFDSIKSYIEKSQIIKLDSNGILTSTPELGELLFGGTKFNYMLANDSLFLKQNEQIFGFEILESNVNAFTLKLENKYFESIRFLKPEKDRVRISKFKIFK